MSLIAKLHRGGPTPHDFTPSDMVVRGACRVGHAVSSLSRLTGHGSGDVIGGRVILAVAPDAPRPLAVGRDVMLVSGTNGKTTTSAFLAAALRTLGEVDSNGNGANTPAGLTTTLAEGHAGRVVLECDEGWLPWTVDHVVPSAVVMLNLSRDQLSRHHEVGMVSSAWRAAMSGVGTVVANADDPDTVWPALAARSQVWVAAGQSWIEDSLTCPSCGARFRREADGWSCTCGLRRPSPDWWLEGDELVSPSLRLPLDLAVPGSFNRANAAMAVAAASIAGADPAKALVAMREIRSVGGRYAWHDVEGHHLRLLLAKNPAGWLELLDLVRGSDKPLVLGFNSEGVDGRDPSWLYDVPFEVLAGREIAVYGRRATDVRVRLEIAGIQPRVRSSLLDAVADLPTGPVDVLANYTAFQDARRELAHVRRH